MSKRGKANKRSLFRRVGESQNWRCCYCGVRVELVHHRPGIRMPPNGATVEHIVPKSYGGGNHYGNCVLACFKCNHMRGTKHPERFARLRRMALALGSAVSAPEAR